MSRVNQHLITVTVDGEDFGVWDTWEGGNIDSEETKYRPGGMAPQKSLGGEAALENVTVTRLYELERDHDLMRRALRKVANGQPLASASRQPLDVDKNPFGAPLIYNGVLKAVQTPNLDSNDDGEAMWGLEISTEGEVG